MTRFWRQWYHSIPALELHQWILQGSVVFKPFQLSKAPLVFIPQSLQTISTNQYRTTPLSFTHYRYQGHVLVPLTSDQYLLSTVKNDEFHATDLLPREIVDNGLQRWF